MVRRSLDVVVRFASAVGRRRSFVSLLAVGCATVYLFAACGQPDPTPTNTPAIPTNTPRVVETPTPEPIATIAAKPRSPDRAALVALFNATDGANWVNNDNWLSDAPIDEWWGITASESGHVTRLDLGGNRLRGRIPPELSRLSHLRVLILQSNELSGEIPPELSRLTNLTDIDFRQNGLSGEIPAEIGELPKLMNLLL